MKIPVMTEKHKEKYIRENHVQLTQLLRLYYSIQSDSIHRNNQIN